MMKWIGRLFALIGFLVVIGFAAVIFLAKEKGRPQVNPGSVLHIKLDGNIHETQTSFTLRSLLEDKPVSLRSLVEMIEHAKSDPNIIGIMTEIQQPKIGIAQTQELRNALLDFNESGKFSYAYTDTFGELSPATNYYYLAASHQKIWIQPLGHLCVTGIHYEVPFMRKLLEEWDINPQIGRRMEYKTALDSLTEFNMTPAHEESISTVLNSIFDQMVNHMAKDRNLSPDTLKSIFDTAPLYDPQEAVKVNLIDKVGYLYDLKDFIKEQHDPEAHFVSADDYDLHQKRRAKKSTQSIAVIYATGQIIRDHQNPMAFGDDNYISLNQIEKAFDEALKDPTTRAIVLRVNSPGGSPIASETIAGHVKRSQKQGIPVIVSMSDVAGSGGYWICCYANKIVAQPTTITGSIGVIGGKIATEKFWNRFGITFDGLDIGKSSSMWSAVKPYDAEGWKKLQSWLDYIYDSFLGHVAAGRHLSLDHVKEIAKGRIWSGEEAKKFGLVDELGGLNKAIALAKSEAHLSLADDIDILEYPEEKSFLEKIAILASLEKATVGHLVKTICRISSLFERPGLKMSFDPEAIR